MIEDVTSKAAFTAQGAVPARSRVTSEAFTVSSGKDGAAPKENGTDPSPISPRLRYDAGSGVVVTEFLDHTGNVQTQSPGNAALAYLRAGLGVDGRVIKKDDGPEEPVHADPAVSEDGTKKAKDITIA